MTSLLEFAESDQSLRLYQQKSKIDIYTAFELSNSVLFQMPTGTGKTRLFVSIIHDIQEISKRDKVRKGVLILVHRSELIEQIHSVLGLKYHIAHGIIQSGHEQEEKFPVQIASVQTIARRLEYWAEKSFDYIIIDEAHHAVAKTYKKICGSFPYAKILGVTATPCRLGKETLKSIFGTLILSDSINSFIEKGYLSRYKYYSIDENSTLQYELDNIDEFDVDGDYSERAMMKVCNTDRIRANILNSYQEYANGKKGIIYTINQRHNEVICEEFKKIGIRIESICSNTPNDKRKEIVNDFRNGKIDIICNVNIFSEGFDCPDIEFILLARPTCSLSMYLQQVGRGLRPHPQKKEAIIIDNVGSYNKFGLPSADRQWRRHFEGHGTKVTKSANSTKRIHLSSKKLTEGEEELILVNTEDNHTEITEDVTFIANAEIITEFPLGAISTINNEYNAKRIFKNNSFKSDPQEIKQDSALQELCDFLDFEENEERKLTFDPLSEWKKKIHEKLENVPFDAYEFDYDLDERKLKELTSGIYLFKDKRNNKVGIVKTDGDITNKNSYRILLAPFYDVIFPPNFLDYSICSKDSRMGVISGVSMNEYIPFQFDDITNINPYSYILEDEGKRGYFAYGSLVIPCIYDELWCQYKGHEKRMISCLNYSSYKCTCYEYSPYKGTLTEMVHSKHKIKDSTNGRNICTIGAYLIGFCDESGELISPYMGSAIGVTDKGYYWILTTNHSEYYLDKDLKLASYLFDCFDKNDKYGEVIDEVICSSKLEKEILKRDGQQQKKKKSTRPKNKPKSSPTEKPVNPIDKKDNASLPSPRVKDEITVELSDPKGRVKLVKHLTKNLYSAEDYHGLKGVIRIKRMDRIVKHGDRYIDFKYTDIELSEDKTAIILYKDGKRPRFIEL